MSTKPNVLSPYKNVPGFLRSMRRSAKLTQTTLAEKLKKKQYWVARIESGARRLDVAEFIEVAEACGREPGTALRQLKKHLSS